jgi:hypothetical protein
VISCFADQQCRADTLRQLPRKSLMVAKQGKGSQTGAIDFTTPEKLSALPQNRVL